MHTLEAAINLTNAVQWARLKPYTRRLYLGRAARCSKFLGSARPVARIDRAMVAEMISELVEEEVSTTSIRAYLQVLFSVLREAERHGWRGPFDSRNLMPKGDERRFRVITEKEEQEIIDYCQRVPKNKVRRQKLALWVEFTILTGLRLSETVGGRGGHPDVDATKVKAIRPSNFVNVDLPNGTSVRCLQIVGKGRGRGKERLVPLSARANEILDTCMALNKDRKLPENAEFFAPLSRDYCTKLLRQSWYELALGGRPITPHALRHTYGSRNALRSNIHALQASMGHGSVRTTTQYVHLNPAQVVLGMSLDTAKT